MKKEIKQKNMKIYDVGVSRSTSNGMKKYTSSLFILILVFSFIFPLFSYATKYILIDKWGYTNPITNKLVVFDTESDCKISAKTILTATITCVNSPTLSNTGQSDTNGAYYFNDEQKDGTNKTFSWLTLELCNRARSAYLELNKDKTLSKCDILNLNTNKDVYTVDSEKNNYIPSTEYKLLAPIPGMDVAPKNIGDYFNIIFKLAIGICAVLAVIMIVIGGIQYMGDESVFGKTEAKSQITKAILGLLIAIGSYALLNTINPAMLGKSGLNIKQVSAEIQDEVEKSPWNEYSPGTENKNCPEGFGDVFVNGKNGMPVSDTNPAKINVCNSIKDKLTWMINAAARNTDATGKLSPISLSGWGSRSFARQLELRKENGCPNEDMPSTACEPDTAQAGHSMHESGLAVDFTCNGMGMSDAGGRNSVCFKWLEKNASSYGFKNLKSESWHWSTTGQ